MKTRIITGIVLVLVILPCVIIGQIPFQVLLALVAAAGIWIYSYTFFDTLKRKYELMIKDLKDLLLLKY